MAITLAGAGMAGAQTLDSFGVLGGSTVTNTGTSVITGDVGVSPGSAITGFPPGIVVAPYTIHVNDGVAIQAQSELETAFNDLSGRVATVDLTNQDLGGLTLTPGVYSFDAAAQLTGTLTLDGLANPNARFIFIVGSALTTASSSAVLLQNGAQGANVSFVVGSSATLGTDTAFAGEILALTSITLNTGADIICGAALARNGAVTLDTNTISICTVVAADLGDVVGGSPTDTATENEMAVADAIDDFVAGGGTLPEGFADLAAFLSAEDLQTALAQLGGETATAVAPAGIEATRGFLSQISDRLASQGSPLSRDRAGAGEPLDEPGSSTVRVLGYGTDGLGPLTAVAGKSPGYATRGTLDPQLWNAWAAATGSHDEVDGDDGTGSNDRRISTASFAAGVDFRLRPDTIVGVAFSGGRADFGLSDGFGGGESDIVQAALYSRTDFNAAYLSGALAVAFNDIETHRSLSVGGSERFDASFSAYNIAGQIEAGYRFALPDIAVFPGAAWVIPYGALQVQNFRTESYGETTESGSDEFALDYDDQSTTATHTELGLRLEHGFELDSDAYLTLRSRLAWGHDDGDDTEVEAGFRALSGSSFTLRGAERETDSLLVSAGADVQFANGFSAGGLFDGRFADSAMSYGATVRLGYAW